MSTTTAVGRLSRILDEGYGPGAWHGADLKAALADVEPARAFWRPAPGRHNIAEIAVHHAYYARAVSAQISGTPVGPFPFDGEDWFEIASESTLTWPRVLATVDEQQRRLAAVVADVEAGTASSPLGEDERFKLILGITSHAIYHAGQIQLIKRLAET